MCSPHVFLVPRTVPDTQEKLWLDHENKTRPNALEICSLQFSPIGFNFSEKIGNNSLQVIGAFGHGIFVKYVWAFELVSLILTIIVAGLTLFNRANKEEE